MVPSTGYKIENGVCSSLGINKTEIVVPSELENPDKGIRVGYIDGEKVSVAVTKMFSMDFICDKSVVGAKISDLKIRRNINYHFRVLTQYACNATYEDKSCPLKPYPAIPAALATRPSPQWFDDVKFGIFIHWSLFSVPAFKSEWYYKYLHNGQEAYVKYHNKVYGCSGIAEDKYPCDGKRFGYDEFADMFQAQLYNASEWAELFKSAGAEYVVLTTKHHDGFCNYPSPEHYLYNSMERGSHRDLTGELTKAVKSAGMHMGLYHSIKEWGNSLFIKDKKDKTRKYVDQVLHPSLIQITKDYEPDLIWSDGSDEVDEREKYWQNEKFLSWLYSSSNVKDKVIVNSRWGYDGSGDYLTGSDRYLPDTVLDEKYECCFTMTKDCWCYDKTKKLSDFYSSKELINDLIRVVATGGNMLINVGPTSEGRITVEYEERLRDIGKFMKVNGEAIYKTKPYKSPFDDVKSKKIAYTVPKDNNKILYVLFSDWPKQSDNKLTLTIPRANENTKISLLGDSKGHKFTFENSESGLIINFPTFEMNDIPNTFFYVLKLENVD